MNGMSVALLVNDDPMLLTLWTISHGKTTLSMQSKFD
jgi:hypothetical protein